MTPPFDYDKARDLRLSADAEKPAAPLDRVESGDVVARPLESLLPEPETLKALATVGVTLVGEMLARCAEPAGRSAVAEATGLGGGHLERWALRLDLLRIRGMTPDFTAMLERVGAGSLVDLRDRRADRLSDAILAVQAEHELVGIVPSAAVIEGWIRQAAHIEPIVTASESRGASIDD